MNDNEALAILPGVARRHDNWDEVTAISSIGRRTMSAIPNYRLLRAATCIDATAAARLLLVHLIGYLGPDDDGSPTSRFVVFPGNTRLSDELRCSVRSIQRQADELEEIGMIRRCYNGLNRRTAFDLTPFAMRHGTVVAEICEIHTKRRMDAEANQLELGLGADRVERPFGATSMSSGGDAGVTLNRPLGSSVCSRASVIAALCSVDPAIIADVPAGAFVGFDRTEDILSAAAAHATTRFTRGGRTPSLAWAAAVNGLGMQAAVGLYATASADPRRKASIERYFSWLLRMATDGRGGDAVLQAAARAAANPRTAMEEAAPIAGCKSIGDAVATVLGRRADAPAAQMRDVEESLPLAGTADRAVAIAEVTEQDLWEPMGPPQIAPGAEPARSMDRAQAVHEAVRSSVGPRLFSAWLEKASFEVREDLLVVAVPGAFAANWVTSHLKGELSRIVDDVAPGLTLKVERMGVGAAV
jgi:DNA-binding Lrp family transcriptional regulator